MASESAGGAVDFSYLEGFCGGDMRVVTEVLTVFRDQAQSWLDDLDEAGAGWRDLVHTIKGTSRGVGARALGDAAEAAERLGPGGLRGVKAELKAAVAAIEGYLTRVGGN